MKAHNYVELPLSDLVADYKDNKHAVREFAKAHQVTIQTVYSRLKDAGFLLRRGGDANTGTQAGQKNPNWKDGTTKRKDGYILERQRGKQRFQHRLVMERIMGRPLLKSEVVHHKNGKPWDNRPENLELLGSNAEHIRKHHNDHKRLSDAGKTGCAIRWKKHAALKAREPKL